MGEVGCGKSTILAHCVSSFLQREKAAKNSREGSCTVATAANSSRLLDLKNTGQSNFLGRMSSPKILANLRSSNKSRRIQIDEGSAMLKGGLPSVTTAGMQLRVSEAEDYKCSLSANTHHPLSASHTSVGHSWNVFYHFVGSIPRSADLRHLLQRLSHIDTSCGRNKLRTMRSKGSVNSLASDVQRLLSRRGTRKILLVIDGVDEASLSLL